MSRLIIIIKTAKNEHSNDYHYYFKVTIGFQFLTTIRYGEQGIGWAWADPGGGGGGGGGGAGGLDPTGKSHVIWVDLDLNPLPAPDEISWIRAWLGTIYFTGMH